MAGGSSRRDHFLKDVALGEGSKAIRLSTRELRRPSGGDRTQNPPERKKKGPHHGHSIPRNDQAHHGHRPRPNQEKKQQENEHMFIIEMDIAKNKIIIT